MIHAAPILGNPAIGFSGLGFLGIGVVGGGSGPQPPEGYETLIDEFNQPVRDELGGYVYAPIAD